MHMLINQLTYFLVPGEHKQLLHPSFKQEEMAKIVLQSAHCIVKI